MIVSELHVTTIAIEDGDKVSDLCNALLMQPNGALIKFIPTGSNQVALQIDHRKGA
jgi:hypothetical protein